MKVCALFVLLLFSLSINAQTPSSNRELCEQLEKAKIQFKENEKTNLSLTKLQLMIQTMFPSSSYHLRQTDSPTKSKTRISKVSPSRHLIVSLGVPSDDDLLLKEYLDLQKRLRNQTKVIASLLKIESVGECVSRANALGFSPEEYFKLREGVSQMTVQRRNQEYHEVMDSYQKLSKSLKNIWELRTGLHVAELKKLLDSNAVDHLIIVAHANSSGHLIDSFGNYFPQGFFLAGLSTLKSISVFSCHAKKVVTTYHLQTQSNGPVVYFPESRLSHLDDVTQISALASFVKRVSRRINYSFSPNLNKTEDCYLELIRGKLVTGEISFLLGDQYLVGHYSEGENIAYKFDCDLLKEENMVSVRSLSIDDDLTLSEDWTLVLKSSDSIQKLDLVEHFYENGFYKGSLYIMLGYP